MLKLKLALIFFTVCLWAFAGIFFFISFDVSKDAKHLAVPLSTSLQVGAEIHVEGTILPTSTETPTKTILSPLTQTECIAARLDIHYVTTYRAKNREHDDRISITILRLGPDHIPILALSTLLALPLSRLEPDRSLWEGTIEHLPEIPPSIPISHLDLDRAIQAARGTFKHFELQEWVLTEGQQVFVAATLSNKQLGNARLLDPDPILQEVGLFPGTQADLLDSLQSSTTTYRDVAWRFIAGGAFLLAILWALHRFVHRPTPKTLPPPL